MSLDYAQRVMLEHRALQEHELESLAAATGANLAYWEQELQKPLPPDQADMVHRIQAVGGERLAAYLDDVKAFLCRYVAFPSEHESVAIALWVGHAWNVERFETSPLLAATSAEMRSGKTRLMELLELLVPHPFRVVTPSEAVTYTLLAERPRRTMLLDEADAIFGPRTTEKYEGLRAILNAGNRQGSPVPRVKLDGKRRQVDWFDVFGPKAIAGIGTLPDTVTDRSIPIRLKRRAADEWVEKFRRRKAEAEASSLRHGPPAVPVVTDVPVPDELNDRAADSWEPLLAIADAAGGSWPIVARLAAVALSSEDEAPASIGMRLLADIREVFDGRDHLPTADLLAGLHQLDDGPWDEWYGKPLSARALAKLLAPYRVLPTRRRLGRGNLRGYFAIDFEDAWERYVLAPVPGTRGTTGTGSKDVPDVPGVPVSRQEPAGLFALSTNPPCFDDPDEYRAHEFEHYRDGSGWGCRACEAAA